MKPQISSRDLQYLSLYLDEQLKPAERQHLERRLEQSEALRKALAELGATRRVLRSVPKARAPRNFDLTPQMVGQKPFVRTLPTLGFISALASFLFVLVLAGDLLGVLNGATKSSALQQVAQYEAAAPALESAPEKRTMEVTATSELLFAEPESAQGAADTAALTAPGASDVPTESSSAAIPEEGEPQPAETAEAPLAEMYAKEAPSQAMTPPEEEIMSNQAVPTEIVVGVLPAETQAAPTSETGMPTDTYPAGGANAVEIPSEPALSAALADEGTSLSQEPSEGEIAEERLEQEKLASASAPDEARSDAPTTRRVALWVFESALALIALTTGALVLLQRRRQRQ